MTNTIIYSTDKEQENSKNTNNLTMIDYLASEGYLQGTELETAEELIKAFRQQKSLSCGLNYDKLFVDGGKQDPQWEVIIQANRKWMEFENLLKKQANFVEKYLCIEKTIEQYEKELGKLKLMEVIGKLVLIVEKLTRLRCSDWDLMIMELRKRVKFYGFKKTCRQAKIDFKTLQKILNGNKNINFRSIERLINFFEMEKIKR